MINQNLHIIIRGIQIKGVRFKSFTREREKKKKKTQTREVA